MTLAIAGCSKAASLEREYANAKKVAGSETIRCKIAREIQEEYIRSGDAASAQGWGTTARFDCSISRLRI
jgi:hypothetical protein